MLVIFSKTKDNPFYGLQHGPIVMTTKEPHSYEIIETKRGKMLKMFLGKKNVYDPFFAKAFEAAFTSEWMYIPMKYVLQIKEGVSTEDYFKHGF